MIINLAGNIKVLKTREDSAIISFPAKTQVKGKLEGVMDISGNL